MESKLQVFKNEELGQVRVVVINNEPMFVGKDLVESLGYKKKYYDVIKRYCDDEDYLIFDEKTQPLGGAEFNYKELGQRGGYLVNESGMYALIFGSKLESAKRFKKWVTSEVLPSIRKYGAYINENEESVDKDYIKYTYGQLEETFSKTHIEDLRETYLNCIEWYKKENIRLPYKNNSKRRKGSKHTATETRSLVMRRISLILNTRSLALREEGKFGLASEIDDVIKMIKDEITKLSNRVNGGKLAGKTKEIKHLQSQLEFHNPDIEDFVCVNYHPYSVNSMYESYIDEYGKLNKRRTYGYNKWINEFPGEEIINNFSDIDLSKPTKLWLKFDCVNKYDTDNLIKSIQDMLVRILDAEDDNNISLGGVEINKRVNSFKDGKIYIMLKNI